MSVQELKALAREHWTTYLPNKVAELRKEGTLEEELQAAASLAQQEIDHLMKYQGYQEHEAREVALPLFILLRPEEGAGLSEEQQEELAEMEREHRRNPPVFLD